jgi:hypothetical protein
MAFWAAILITAMNSSFVYNRNIPDINRGIELFRQFKYLITDYGSISTSWCLPTILSTGSKGFAYRQDSNKLP